MKNKQVELIIHAISNQELEQYMVDAYNTPINLLKARISKVLKGVKPFIGK